MDGRNLSELYTPVSHYKQEGPKIELWEQTIKVCAVWG